MFQSLVVRTCAPAEHTAKVLKLIQAVISGNKNLNPELQAV